MAKKEESQGHVELSTNYGTEGFSLDSKAVSTPDIDTTETLGSLGDLDLDAGAQVPCEILGFENNLGGLGTVMSASVSNLEWLEAPDAGPLPEQNLEISPELEAQWDLSSISPADFRQDLGLIHEAQDWEREESAPVESAEAVMKAHRILASTKSLEAAQSVPGISDATKDALAQDAGLAGHVYVRASSYPECEHGKWSILKKSKASFVIAKPHCSDCVFNESGKCMTMGMEIVSKVSWTKAAKMYLPRLKLDRKVRVGPSLKETLRAAFLAGPDERVVKNDHAVVPHIADTVTADQAHKILSEAKPAVFSLTTRAQRSQAMQKRKATAYLKALGARGMLPKSAVEKLLSSNASPDAKIQTALKLVESSQSAKTSEFSGIAQSSEKLSTENAWEILKQSANMTASSQDRLNKHLWKKASDRVDALVATGLLTVEQASKVAAAAKSPSHMLGYASALVEKYASERFSPKTQGQVSEYSGEGREAMYKLIDRESSTTVHSGASRAAAIASREARVREEFVSRITRGGMLTSRQSSELAAFTGSLRELAKMATEMVYSEEYDAPKAPMKMASYQGEGSKVHLGGHEKSALEMSRIDKAKAVVWLRRAMSGGAAGERLDQMIRTRFNREVIEQTSEVFRKARKDHEGLSGHVYVDARAYATAGGVRGCVRGGDIHRGNDIKAILPFEGCVGCVFAKQSSSEVVCQKYNKALLQGEIKDRESIRSVNIRAVNATDFEITSGRFAPSDAEVLGLLNRKIEVNLRAEVDNSELKNKDFQLGKMDL